MNRKQYSYFQGRQTEEKFVRTMKANGLEVTKSTRSEDIKQHIDYWLHLPVFNSRFSVDVKGNRHLDCIWLELKNVRGNKGWLDCCSNYIVLDIAELGGFCFFDRVRLLNFAQQFKEVAKNKTEFYKLYTRKGRKDVLVKVRYEDIKHIEAFFYSYDNF